MVKSDPVIDAVRMLVIAVVYLFLGTVIGYLISAINVFVTGAWLEFIGVLFAAGILLFGMSFHKGKESFLQDLPIMLIIVGLGGLVSLAIPELTYVVQFSLSGMALMIGLIYTSREIVSRYI